jgi:hypothetical protein
MILPRRSVEGRQRGESLDASDVQRVLAQAPPTMLSFSLSLAKAEMTFAAATGILGVGDGSRTREEGPSA